MLAAVACGGGAPPGTNEGKESAAAVASTVERVLAAGEHPWLKWGKIPDVAPLDVETKQTRSVTVPPLAAGGVAVLGLVLALAGARKK